MQQETRARNAGSLSVRILHVHTAAVNAYSNDEQARLIDDAKAMGVAVSSQGAAKVVRLLDELAKWNRTHNLTAITAREEMITHHLLDSLSVHAHL